MIAAAAFLLLLVGCNPSSPQTSITTPSNTTNATTTNSPPPHLLTAEEAVAASEQLANDKATKLYGHSISMKQLQATLEEGHWTWGGNASDGHSVFYVEVQLALDGSTNSVDTKYVPGWLP
jgi:hypothetical protein